MKNHSSPQNGGATTNNSRKRSNMNQTTAISNGVSSVKNGRHEDAEIIDEDDDPALVNLSIVNEACPWLTLNIENRRIDVSRGATDSSDVGAYPFEIILSDNNIYGKAEVRYIDLIQVTRLDASFP